ncbi:unnamed protein product [Cladocopium goreaui]|uniref:Uncharacterized protein n=1 Tax=Cladocopium goreaui TaxID=2562237 RepID=A0A9P1CZU1_9DINO|nr:unnamed protein product [Cladocopium goreaui]
MGSGLSGISTEQTTGRTKRSCELESGAAFRSQTEEEELTMRPMIGSALEDAWWTSGGITSTQFVGGPIFYQPSFGSYSNSRTGIERTSLAARSDRSK